MKATHIIAATVACLLAVLLSFAGYRVLKHERDEPVRAGISMLKEGDYQNALVALLPLAEGGHPLAQRTVGMIYARGSGVPVDETRAQMWFRRAECQCADPGQAEFDTGLDLLRVDQPDLEAALRWIQRAAEAGHPRAQTLLADSAASESEGLIVDLARSNYWKAFLSSSGNAQEHP